MTNVGQARNDNGSELEVTEESISRVPLEPLLRDRATPRRARLLGDQAKTGVLVQRARGVEALEGVQIHMPMTRAAAEGHRGVHQPMPLAPAADGIAQHEPAQVRLAGSAVAVDNDRSVHVAVVDHEPHAVACRIKTRGELRELARDLRFEQHTEAMLARVVLAMQAADGADRAGQITRDDAWSV